ncbi:MAG: sugar phosphate nucleotidyltransferase [Bryobacteraceae bacterium]
MFVRKAVITAAARRQRALPLQTLIDRDGAEKSVLSILIEQSLAAGAEEIAVVVWPGDESRYAQAAGPHASAVRFIPQPEPRGYGHAIHCASSFTGSDPFLHMVGDHLYVSAAPKPSAERLVELARAERCSVSGVQATRESLLARYGTVGGRRFAQRSDLYRVDTVIEKPTPTEAEQRLLVPGIRAGYYLCFFGIHVLTPAVMEILGRMLAAASGTPVTLTDALAELARQEQYLAVEDDGRRYDLGSPYGLFIAQLALALNGPDRSQVLSQVLELLADREIAAAGGGARP